MSAATAIEVTTLVGPNGDVHVYYAVARRMRKKLAAAKIVFVNGLGLEGWLPRLVKASGTKRADRRRDQGHQAARCR